MTEQSERRHDYSLVSEKPGEWRVRNLKTGKFVGRVHKTMEQAIAAANKLPALR